MKLTVLGTSSGIFNPKSEYRFPAAHLVELGNSRILLDCSLAVLPQITKLELTVNDIQTIAISHFHADHFNLAPLMQTYFLQGAFMNNKAILHILGPKGTEERAIRAFNDSGFDYQNDFLPNVNIRFSEYTDGQSIDLGNGATLTPFKTTHYGLDAYSLRLEAGQKALAYSGDSAVSEGLSKAADRADLFLCESFMRLGQNADDGHVGPVDAAEIANRAQAKHLVLTHYSGFDPIDLMADAARKTGYDGEVSVASDLDVYEL